MVLFSFLPRNTNFMWLFILIDADIAQQCVGAASVCIKWVRVTSKVVNWCYQAQCLRYSQEHVRSLKNLNLLSSGQRGPSILLESSLGKDGFGTYRYFISKILHVIT